MSVDLRHLSSQDSQVAFDRVHKQTEYLTIVNPGISSTSEFSFFMEDPAHLEPAALQNRLPTLSGAGILINSPAVKIPDYSTLVCTELLLKKKFLSTRQQVHYLRLIGFPFRQFDGYQLTELLFRLCSSYNVLEGHQGERSITLEPEQCIPDNLALLKGLGFNTIRAVLDISTVNAEQTLTATLHQALANINTYGAFTIAAMFLLSNRSQLNVINGLASFLAQSGVVEMEFNWKTSNAYSFKEAQICQPLLKPIHGLMERLNYQLFGDHCFKTTTHPDTQLLKNNRLAYGPWGFHNSSSPEWLALGVNAEGMIGGYLYQNTSDTNDYRTLIHARLSPVDRWSYRPMVDETTFDFIQQLYCYHRVEKHFFTTNPALITLFDNLKAMNWVEEQGKLLKLTPEGCCNISTLCNLYSRSR